MTIEPADELVHKIESALKGRGFDVICKEIVTIIREHFSIAEMGDASTRKDEATNDTGRSASVDTNESESSPASDFRPRKMPPVMQKVDND